MKELNLQDIDLSIIKQKHVLIVASCWNKEWVEQLTSRVLSELATNKNINVQVIKVPGSWEIPYIVKRSIHKYHAIIAIGVLIKGATKHFEYIAKNVFNALMQCQLEDGACPVINGVLTVMNENQIEERIPLGTDWARSCLLMMKQNE